MSGAHYLKFIVCIALKTMPPHAHRKLEHLQGELDQKGFVQVEFRIPFWFLHLL